MGKVSKVDENTLNSFFNGMDVPDPATLAEENANKGDGEKVVSREEYEAIKKELNDTKSKYGASSANAKRLHEKTQAFEKYSPIYDLLEKDEGAVNALSNYINKNQSVQDSVKAELGLDSDFEYSEQDAVNNPDSDSAKVMQRMMEITAEKVSNKKAQDQEAKFAADKRREVLHAEGQDLKAKYNLNEEDFNSFIDKVNSHKMTLEDLYLVINKDKVQENLVNNIVKEKLGNNSQSRRSLASVGDSADKSVESSIMDVLVSVDHGTDKEKGLTDFFNA